MNHDTQPLVSVVSVNHNGVHLLPALLNALRAQTYQRLEVVVVDNASSDGSVEMLRQDYPEVRVLELSDNRGFVGGNNAGIRVAKGDLVALANNDTVPEPTWLEELVRTLLADEELAAVGSKILFLHPYLPVRLTVEGRGQATGGGKSGILLSEATAFAGCEYRKPVFVQGFAKTTTEAGRLVRRVADAATLFLPVPAADDSARLDLVAASASHRTASLRVRVGEHPVAILSVGPRPGVHPVTFKAAVVGEESFDLINNAGTALSPRGDTADRGIYEPDRGQFDREEDLEAICGAAVLLRRSALDRVGLFDRDFFMYYEDTDLSWRLRRAGYRLRYQPRSRIRHVHAATSVEWSPLFTFYTARNKILMIAKNAGLAELLRAYAAEVRCMIGLLAPSWRLGTTPEVSRMRRELGIRLRVQASLLKQVPRAWLKRGGLVSH